MEIHEQDEINLSEILNIIKQKAHFILLLAVIGAVVGFGCTKLFVARQYSSYGTIIINNRREGGTNITNDEINSAKGLASVYSIIIKSDPIMNQVISDLSLDYATSELSSMVSVTSVNATQILRVTVTTTNPDLSAKIANKILEIAPTYIVEKVEAGSVNIISEAQINRTAVSPNASRNALLIFIVGIFGMCVIFVLFEVTDKSIKSKEDIERVLGYPLLGIIPNTDSVKGGSK